MKIVYKKQEDKTKIVYLIIILFIILGCSNEKKTESRDKHELSTLTAHFDFPREVYTNRKYKGKITFSNTTFDTIVEPRIDTIKFRYIIYKPFQIAKSDEKFTPIFKDSVLLDNNTVDIELEFDEPGVYNIGGFARDVLMIGYYTGNVRDSVRLRENTVTMIKKIIVKDSI